MGEAHDKPNECPLCEFKVDGEPELTRANIDDIVQSNSQYSCFTRMERHLRYVHVKGTKKCAQCGASFASSREYVSHIRTHRECMGKSKKPNKMRLCNSCGQMIDTRVMAQHNHEVHGMVHRFSCPQCPKKYMHCNSLKTHLLRVHLPERKEFACETCGMAFADKGILVRHLKVHKQPHIKCTRDGCDKMFKWKSGVFQHLEGEAPSLQMPTRISIYGDVGLSLSVGNHFFHQ